MGDATLIALAVERPESRDALARVSGMPRPLVAGKAWKEILARIGRAMAEPTEGWPEVRAARRVTDDPAQRKRYRELRRGCDAVATELGLEPSLVASRAVLEGIATKETAGEDWKEVPELRAWQIRLLEAVIG
jgi:ribonuclease D